MENLRIDEPCPTLINRMNKCGDDFHCKGCNKMVYDFRKKSDAEIKEKLNQDICGVFTQEQLQGQRKFSFGKKIVFNSLMFLSFIGFNVKPVAATSSNFYNLEDEGDKISKKEKRKAKRKARKARKKKDFNTIMQGSFTLENFPITLDEDEPKKSKKELRKERRKARRIARKKPKIGKTVTGCPSF